MNDKETGSIIRRLKMFFGGQWERQFAPDISLADIAHEWSLALEKVSYEVANAAIDLIRDKSITYAPNIPKFMEICKEVQKEKARSFTQKNEKRKVKVPLPQAARNYWQSIIEAAEKRGDQEFAKDCKNHLRLLIEHGDEVDEDVAHLYQ